jgi:hypothetical protein
MGVFLFVAVAIAVAAVGPMTAAPRRDALRRSDVFESWDATVVTAAAAAGVMGLGAVGTFFQLLGANVTYGDAPNGIPAATMRTIVLTVWIPVLIVVVALVVARVRRRGGTTFVLAMLTPVLPLCLWWAGMVAIASFGSPAR